MPTTIQDLYNHLKTLNKQWFYDKEEVDDLLDVKLDAVDVPTKISDLDDDSDFISKSNTAGLVKNDGTIDTTSYQVAGNYIETSATGGLVKNDGTIDTNTYLTEHQSLANYVAKSSTVGLIKNDGTIDTNTYLTSHQDISGKANSADLATVATSGSYLDLENIPETFVPSAHEHSSADVKDANAHSNLGTSANATQSAINTAIDTKIGSLLSVELVEVASTRPTASASTMNKLYLVPEADAETDDAYEVFVTVEDDGSYSWEKIDTTRIDLSGYVTTDDSRLSDARTPLSHTHGNVTNDGKIGSDSGKVVVTTTGGALTTSDWVTEVDNVIQQLTQYGNTL